LSSAANIWASAPTATSPSFRPSGSDPDTGIGWSAADALSLIAGGVEAMRFTEAAGLVSIDSNVADSASAVAFDFNTLNAYSTSGAKLFSFSNNGTEEISMGYDATEGLTIGPNATNPAIWMGDAGVSGGAIRLSQKGTGTPGVDQMVIQGTSALGLCFFDGVLGDPGIRIQRDYTCLIGCTTSAAASTVVLGDNAATTFTNTIKADYNANRDRDGTNLDIRGGDGGATDRSGGDIGIYGGTKTGSGVVGVVKIQAAAADPLGFYGATPVAQPSGTGETTGFTAGSGTAVNDDSTFTGNVGSTAYRLSDVVKHLKNLGLIAS
jgi:hypothetical protein